MKKYKIINLFVLIVIFLVAVGFMPTATFSQLLKNVDQQFNSTNNEITINYELTKKCSVSIYLLNQNNEIIETLQHQKTQSKGTYTVNFNTTNLADGTYFYQVKAKDLKNKNTEIFSGKIEITKETTTKEKPQKKFANINLSLNLNKTGISKTITGSVEIGGIKEFPSWNLTLSQDAGFSGSDVISSVKSIYGFFTMPLSKKQTNNNINFTGNFTSNDEFAKSADFLQTSLDLRVSLNTQIAKNIFLGIGTTHTTYVYLYTEEKFQTISIPLTITNLKLIKSPFTLKINGSVNNDFSSKEKTTKIPSLKFSIPIYTGIALDYTIRSLNYDWKAKKKISKTVYDTLLTFGFGL